MKHSIKVNQGDSYKVGLDEVVGLKAAMKSTLQPVLDHLNDLESWSGVDAAIVKATGGAK